jgi:Secretory lipase
VNRLAAGRRDHRLAEEWLRGCDHRLHRYTNGSTPEYLAGPSEAHSVLDIVRAAQQVPGSGLGASAPVAIWGCSQGGQPAGWAAELAGSYAPEEDVVGTAAGGVPADLTKIAELSEGGVATALGLDSFVGLRQAHSSLLNPEMVTHEIFTPSGSQ